MKFEEGNNVEVFGRVHDPCGSWFPANIISVDGDCCIVRYDLLTDHEGEPVMEKVPKEDVRHPPNTRGKRWMVGDVAEVFDVPCWRLGKIVKVCKNGHFLVRLFGSIRLEEFHESKLRIQQAWHKNERSVIKVAQNKQSITSKPNLSGSLGKGSRLSKRENLKRFKDKHSIVKRCLPARMANRNNTYCHKRYSDDFLSRNRGCDKPFTRKFSLSRQIDDISCQKVIADEKFREGSGELVACIAKQTTDRLCRSSKPLSSEDTDRCSIASCSLNSFCEFPGYNCNNAWANLADNSDAESSFPPSSVNVSSNSYLEQKLEADVHELEFHAYRSTIRALYASGPLSWEQESLLTNLRLKLHISDEEHLLQLKHLLSTRLL